MSFLAELRREPESDEGSAADEGARPRGVAFCGSGLPVQVGLGHTARDYCDGQSLASPNRSKPEDRRYPETERWKGVVELFRKNAETYTSDQLLVELSLGSVSKFPFAPASISELKNEVIKLAQSYGLELNRSGDDRGRARWGEKALINGCQEKAKKHH